MRLVGLLFDNAGLKVLALCMAWAVWFMVSQGLTDQRSVPLRLSIVVDGDQNVEATLDDPPGLTTITLTVAGPVRSVDRFESVAASGSARIRVRQEDFPPDTEQQVVFRLEDVEIPQLDDFPELRAIGMEPREIRLKVERMEVRDVQVVRPTVPKSVGTANVRIVTWDTMVTIRASAKHLNKQLASLETSVDEDMLAQLASGLGDAPSMTVEVELIPDPAQAGLFTLVDREKITARLELRQIDEAKVTVPVRIVRTVDRGGTSLGSVRFSPGNAVDVRLAGVWSDGGEDGAPPQLTLTLEGSPAALTAVDAATLLAFVLEDEMPADDELVNLPLHIAGLPPGVRVRPPPITLSVERER